MYISSYLAERRHNIRAQCDSEFAPHLVWCGYKIDGSVVAVILLGQAEGELVVYQQSVCVQEARAGYAYGFLKSQLEI